MSANDNFIGCFGSFFNGGNLKRLLEMTIGPRGLLFGEDFC